MKIRVKYEKYDDEMKAHVFDILPEKLKTVRISCNKNISKMAYK